jgi:hypothetical protein
MSKRTGLANAALVGAALLAAALVALLFVLVEPGTEVSPTGPANKAITPDAQVTPDLKGNTPELTEAAPPDTVDAGPEAQQTR